MDSHGYNHQSMVELFQKKTVRRIARLQHSALSWAQFAIIHNSGNVIAFFFIWKLMLLFIVAPLLRAVATIHGCFSRLRLPDELMMIITKWMCVQKCCLNGFNVFFSASPSFDPTNVVLMNVVVVASFILMKIKFAQNKRNVKYLTGIKRKKKTVDFAKLRM